MLSPGTSGSRCVSAPAAASTTARPSWTSAAQVRPQREPRHGELAVGDVAVRVRQQLVHRRTTPAGEGGGHLLVAVHAVGHQRVDHIGDVVHHPAVARAEGAPRRTVVPHGQEARQVLVQVAVRGSDDDGRAVHHVVTRQQQRVLLDRPAEMVRGVTRGVHRPQGETACVELEARAGALVGLEALPRTEADQRGAGDRGECRGSGGVVHVRVGHHDGPYRPREERRRPPRPRCGRAGRMGRGRPRRDRRDRPGRCSCPDRSSDPGSVR